MTEGIKNEVQVANTTTPPPLKEVFGIALTILTLLCILFLAQIQSAIALIMQAS